MRELEVVLAIALTFLVFSSLVSMFVEIGFRFFAIRFKDLKCMLATFYEKELSDLVNDKTEQGKQLFVSHVTKLSANNYSIDVAEFIERLASSELAKKIKQEGKAHTELLVNEFARRYDNYGKAASFAFKRKAARLNMLLSIILALFLNINLATLAYTFLENRSLTDQLIAQAPVILDAAQEQQQDLEAAIKNATQNTNQNPEKTESVEEFTASLNKLNEAVAHIDTLALPIGWSNYGGFGLKDVIPGLVCNDTNTNKCISESGAFYQFINFGFWFVITVITGMLIGLGGPFWFDLVRRISAVRSFFAKEPSSDKAAKQGQKAVTPSNDLQKMRQDLADLFEKTFEANKLLAQITSKTKSSVSNQQNQNT